ncbi:hypothetical protein RhiirA4_476593 [Rhizophagus irregularis]|uniref:Uncharacterized protein n=1 Tax=Rhizophagus irregularis TaxID=588596 RepID=A0A2I1HBW0_9GLOM|nr:hypothetical protein RhiirA4_476593 [Rhizophagus irregularis]
MLPTLTTLQQRKPYLYSSEWLCPQCNSAPKDINHLWTCPYILPDLNPCLTHQNEIVKFRNACIASFSSLKTLPASFNDEFSTLDCWNFVSLPRPIYGLPEVELYGEIWLCRNVLFHAWEESQGISASSKLCGPSSVSHSTTSPHHHNSSLVTVPQDSWIS